MGKHRNKETSVCNIEEKEEMYKEEIGAVWQALASSEVAGSCVK